MKIEFYYISTGVAIPQDETDDCFFVMNNMVYVDNCHYFESQESTVSFESFIKEAGDVGWRVVND
tara:strand:+ start:9457 stop:9651 length:195 start_codon:yes stop_codon:yes gene_type:complete